MDEAIKRNLSQGDFVNFRRRTPKSPAYGEVLSVINGNIRCRCYSPMTSSILTQFSLPTISAESYPVATSASITELFALNAIEDFSVDDVLDIVFILSMAELESGMVFITGASNLFFVRYLIDERAVLNVGTNPFFGYHLIQPLTIRIFSALNTLAYTIKKLMYHRPEAEDTRRSTRFFFPSDAFHYIAYKMSDNPSVVKHSITKNQRIIRYFDDLKSESATKVVDTTYLRVLTRSGLISLRKIIGVGVGIGSTQYKPSKTRPLQYCTINSTLTSVECADELPQCIRRKPLGPCFTDGIDFLYHEQNNTLSCHVRFTRLRVASAEVATSRIPAANVIAENAGAFVGAWFHYDGNTFSIINIDNGICFCQSVEDEEMSVELPIDLVNDLVSNFGS
jgi:hypothetical protein